MRITSAALRGKLLGAPLSLVVMPHGEPIADVHVAMLTATLSATAGRNSYLPRSVARFLTYVAREADCTEEVAFTTRSKSGAYDRLSKLTDVEVRLVATLTEVWERAINCSYDSVMRAARYFAPACGRASSLVHQDIGKRTVYTLEHLRGDNQIQFNSGPRVMTKKSGVLLRGPNIKDTSKAWSIFIDGGSIKTGMFNEQGTIIEREKYLKVISNQEVRSCY